MTEPARPSFWASLRLLVQQAWPVLVGQWAGIAFGVLDTVMTGHASATDLAAMGLAVSIYITLFVGMMGVIHALIPILSQRIGAGQLEAVGQTWGQGVWLALGLSAVGVVLLAFPDVWLSLSGDVDPAVRERIGGYLTALMFALPAALIFRSLHALGTAVARPKVMMTINIAGVGFKALFNWLLIFGSFGLPAMGAVGAGISTALTFWISLCIALLVVRFDPYFRQFALRVGRPNGQQLRELLRLGLPMGGSYLIEVVSFTFMALLVAREGIQVTAAHQIMANLAALSYMAPMAIGIATAALVARTLGAGNPQLARQYGVAGLSLALVAALFTAGLLVTGAPWLTRIYTSDPAVAITALGLLALLPFFHVVDALHTLVLYLLRAHKIAFTPMVLQGIALGGVGLFGGWWLSFGPGAGGLAWLTGRLAPTASTGAATLWLCSAAGLLLSALVLGVFYIYVAYGRPARQARLAELQRLQAAGGMDVSN